MGAGSRPCNPDRGRGVTFAQPQAPCARGATKAHACPQLARSLHQLLTTIVSARKLSNRARNDGLGLSSTEATEAASINTI